MRIRRPTLLRMLERKAMITSSVMLAIFVCLAVFGPYLAPYGPNDIIVSERLQPPNSRHIFGTDDLGRDILSRVVFGTQGSMSVAAMSVLIGMSLGLVMGITSGFYGGMLDTVLGRVMDTILGFPDILLAMVTVAILGPGITNAMIAIGIANIPYFGRLIRAAVLAEREKRYVLSERAIGASDMYDALRHILPNCIAPTIVQISTTLGYSILTAAALSFIGLGEQPPAASWGRDLSDARVYMSVAPWAALFPGLFIILSVLATSVLGDSLNESLNPKLRRIRERRVR